MIVLEAACNNADGHCKSVWTRMSSVEIDEIPEKPVGLDFPDETLSYGCGNAFKSGRCEDGTNPEDCIFENASSRGAIKCSGKFKLVKIP